MREKQFIVAVGYLQEGLKFFGPFPTVQTATDFTEQVDCNCEVLELSTEGTIYDQAND